MAHHKQLQGSNSTLGCVAIIVAGHADGTREYNAHNLYGTAMAKSHYEAITEITGKRPFMILRYFLPLRTPHRIHCSHISTLLLAFPLESLSRDNCNQRTVVPVMYVGLPSQVQVVGPATGRVTTELTGRASMRA